MISLSLLVLALGFLCSMYSYVYAYVVIEPLTLAILKNPHTSQNSSPKALKHESMLRQPSSLK